MCWTVREEVPGTSQKSISPVLPPEVSVALLQSLNYLGSWNVKQHGYHP